MPGLNRARAALIGGLGVAIAFGVLLVSADTGPGSLVEAQTAPSPPAVTDPGAGGAPASAPVAATPAAPPVAAAPVVNGSMTTSLGGSDIAVSSVGGSYEVDGPARKAKKANRKNSHP